MLSRRGTASGMSSADPSSCVPVTGPASVTASDGTASAAGIRGSGIGGSGSGGMSAAAETGSGWIVSAVGSDSQLSLLLAPVEPSVFSANSDDPAATDSSGSDDGRSLSISSTNPPALGTGAASLVCDSTDRAYRSGTSAALSRRGSSSLISLAENSEVEGGGILPSVRLKSVRRAGVGASSIGKPSAASFFDVTVSLSSIASGPVSEVFSELPAVSSEDGD